METLGNIIEGKKGEKGQNDYYCEKCDFKCSKKYSWSRHLSTLKHMMETTGNDLETKKGKKGQFQLFTCELCDKSYKNRSGLWKHKQYCFMPENQDHNFENIAANKLSIDDKDDLIIQLLKQNAKLMEILENGTTNNSHNTTTNSHNKAFNLNFFLS
jgi:hypothetical protein